MATPIDATLAAFITQAVREAMAEERQRESYTQRRAPVRDESQHRAPVRDESQRRAPVRDEPLNRVNRTNEPSPFTWGFPWAMTEQAPPAATTTNTKKVRITEPETEKPRTQSRFGFGIPSIPTYTNTSNSVATSAHQVMNIPNKDNHIKLISGKDNVMKPSALTNRNTDNTGLLSQSDAAAFSLNSRSPGVGLELSGNGTGCQVEPTHRPPQPSYPPPVYQGLPELVSSSESTEDEADNTNPTTNQQQKPNENNNLSTMINAASAALGMVLDEEYTDRDTLNGILTSFLGADVTRELETLADEMVGTTVFNTEDTQSRPSERADNTALGQEFTDRDTINILTGLLGSDMQRKVDNLAAVVAKTTIEPKQEQPTARKVCIAYKALRKYINEVIKVKRTIYGVIFDYLDDMFREKLYDANILPRPTLFAPEKFNQDTHKGVVKAICAELSISTRFSAVEDMIKNMPYSELMKFKHKWWFNCDGLPGYY